MIIADEVSYIRNIIFTRVKPPDMTVNRLIRYIATLYVPSMEENEKTRLPVSGYTEFVLGIIRGFNFPMTEYQEYQHVKYTKKICQKLVNGQISGRLKEVREVSVTEAEIETVKRAGSEKGEKLLFTLFVLSRISTNPTGWVNYPVKEIFTAANIGGTLAEKYGLIHELYTKGLLGLNHIIDKHGYSVELHEDSPVAMTVTDFTNLGNQYLNKYKKGWMMCQKCGCMIKRHSGRQKYCRKCAKEMDAKRHVNRQIRYRKTKMLTESSIDEDSNGV